MNALKNAWLAEQEAAWDGAVQTLDMLVFQDPEIARLLVSYDDLRFAFSAAPSGVCIPFEAPETVIEAIYFMDHFAGYSRRSGCVYIAHFTQRFGVDVNVPAGTPGARAAIIGEPVAVNSNEELEHFEPIESIGQILEVCAAEKARVTAQNEAVAKAAGVRWPVSKPTAAAVFFNAYLA